MSHGHYVAYVKCHTSDIDDISRMLSPPADRHTLLGPHNNYHASGAHVYADPTGHIDSERLSRYLSNSKACEGAVVSVYMYVGVYMYICYYHCLILCVYCNNIIMIIITTLVALV